MRAFPCVYFTNFGSFSPLPVKNHFHSYSSILLMDFSAYAEQVTSSLAAYVEAFKASSSRPLVYLPTYSVGISGG